MKKYNFDSQNFIEINQTELKQKIFIEHQEVAPLGDLKMDSFEQVTDSRFQINCTIRVGIEEYDQEDIPAELERGNIWDEKAEIVIELAPIPKIESIRLVARNYAAWIEIDEREIIKELSFVLDAEIYSIGFNEVDTLGGDDTFKLRCEISGETEEGYDLDETIWVTYPVKDPGNQSYQEIQIDGYVS